MTMSTPIVLFPTDLSGEVGDAFAQALRIALGMKGALEILHITTDDATPNWAAQPTVRETLVRWKVLPDDATVDAFHALGLQVKVNGRRAESPVDGVLAELAAVPADLVVMATHARHGLERVTQGSVSEAIARKSGRTTLFAPIGASSLVVPADGRVQLQHVLIPMDAGGVAPQAIAGLERLASAVGVERLHVHLLFVGKREELPDTALGQTERWSWSTEVRESNDLAAAINDAAVANSCDLIVMVTHGHDSLGDALFGSTTERVLRYAKVPVLSIPVG